MQWSQDNVCKLIDVYRSKEILWDPGNPNYFNKILKHDAWTEISQEMNNCPIEQLKKKIDNLLGQLRREKARVKKKTTGQGADEVYTPSWYAYEHMSFLLNRNKPRNRLNTENLDANSGTQDDHSHNAQIQNEESQNLQVEQENEQSENAESQNLQIEKENEQSQNSVNLSSNNEIDTSGNTFSNSSFKPPLPKKKKINSDNSQNQRMMNSALQLLSSASTAAKAASARAAATSSPLDESQLYANFIASKFRLYSQRTKNVLQHEISNLLFQADTGQYDYYQQPYYGYAYSAQQNTPPPQSPSPQLTNQFCYNSPQSTITNESENRPMYYNQTAEVSPTADSDLQTAAPIADSVLQAAAPIADSDFQTAEVSATADDSDTQDSFSDLITFNQK